MEKAEAKDMVELKSRPRLAGYILTRGLTPGDLGERHLALRESDLSSHVVHRPALEPGRAAERRFLGAMKALREFRQAHVLEIEDYGVDKRGRTWAVTPYTGDREGMVSLESLLRAKGGFLSPNESRHAVLQLLEAVAAAHAVGHRHGAMSLSQVLVDRRGSLQIELYGLGRLVGLCEPEEEDPEQAEVRSVVRLGYRLVTGLVPDEPIIPASRVLIDLDPAWDDWFETGLIGGPGFRSAAHALSAIVDRRSGAWNTGGGRVRTVLRALLGSAR